MAAHLIAIRRPAMHAGDLLPHPPPQLLAARWRHDASVGAGIRWMGRRTSPVRRTARPLGGGWPIARTGQRPAGRVRRTRHQDIRMHMDRPLIQDHSDARRLRSGGAPVRGARRQRRSANPLRPPGDCLARHDVQPAHDAQVALGRPTPFRPHRIGACPPIPVGQGGRRVTGTSSRYTVTTWSGCACAYAATSAISCRLD